MANELVLRDTFDVTGYAGPTGLENIGVEDISMSWLAIAAKNTDAANEDSKDYIQGLKPGFFYVRNLSRVYGKSVKLVALKYFKSYAEYTPGDDKTFVRSVTQSEAKSLVRVGSIYPLANGNVVKEAFNFLVVIPEDPEAGILRLQLGAGAFKHVKNWLTLMVNGKLPIWAPIWEVTTALMTSNDGKNTYYSIGAETTQVKRVGFIPDSIKADILSAFEQAQGFNENTGRATSTEEYDVGPL
jgi:hypothetical protein